MTDENLTDRQILDLLATSSRRLTVPVDLASILDRLEADLSPREAPRFRWRRLAVASLALSVAGTGLLLAGRLLGTDAAPPAVHPATYFLELPKAAPQDRTGDVYVFEVRTNLPEGTLSQVLLETPVFTSPVCCPEVHQGILRIEILENPCVLKKGFIHGTHYRIELTVAPEVDSGIFGCPFGRSCGPPTYPQPAPVRKRLGEDFEYVRGGQVIPYFGRHALRTARDYELPSTGCSWGPGPGPDPAPHLEMSPDHGPVGAHIELHGTGFFAPWFQPDTAAYMLGLIRTIGECEVIAGDAHWEISKAGVLTGYLTVPQSGSCFQRPDLAPQPITPGSYGILLGCHACIGPEFRVTQR